MEDIWMNRQKDFELFSEQDYAQDPQSEADSTVSAGMPRAEADNALRKEASVARPQSEQSSPAPSSPPYSPESRTEESKRLYIIDGYGLIYRSYFAFINRPLRDGEGKNVSALFGFFNTLLMLLREYRPDYLVVAMDSKGPTFRHDMYAPYKANRDKAPEDLHEQVPRIVEILEALGIPQISIQGVEADDIIATLTKSAQRFGIDSIMVTGDKDLLQLVDSHTFALRPPKKGESAYRLFGEQEVKSEFGITASQIVDYLSLLGDSSDNVPGVTGIGEKGAVKLLQEYGDLEGIYAHLDECSKGLRSKLEEGREHAKLSKDLVALRSDMFQVDSFDTPEFLVRTVHYERAIPLLEQANAKSLVAGIRKMMDADVIINRKESPIMPAKAIDQKSNEADAASVDIEPSMLEDHRSCACSYVSVETLDDLEALLSRMENEGGIMAFDLETTSIETMEAVPVGFSFTNREKQAWYVPLVAGGVRVLDDEPVRRILRSYLESGRLALVGQNIKYDYKVLCRWGVRPVKIVFDTMIAAWLLDSTRMSYGMDALAEIHLHYKTIHYTDVVPDGKLFSDVPVDLATRYGAEDSDVTWRLYRLFRKELEARGMLKLLSDLEMPLLTILADMELAGVRLDADRLGQFGTEISGRLDEIQKEIFALCGHEFNISSPQQLQQVLFVERNLPTGKKTRTGFSTATDTLESLADLDPVPALILQHRALSKLKNTYIDTLPSLIDPATGRIHPTFVQTGTATGRLSCRNPNLQNIPVRSDDGRRIRGAFIPADGCKFLSADYSQIELVVLAHMADDPGLKAAFLAGVDVHRHTASLIFGVPSEEVTADQRRIAKTINFGVMYGMSAFRLANELKIKRSEAQAFIDAYFARYSGVRDFVGKVRADAEVHGMVRTLLGHERAVPEIRSANKTEKAGAERIVVNTVIQGTAADIMKLAMLRIARRMHTEHVRSRLLLQVHDELIFEVPQEELEKMGTLVKEEMERAVKLSVPLKASVEFGRSWGEMH
jgi:DNA polymerase-1